MKALALGLSVFGAVALSLLAIYEAGAIRLVVSSVAALFYAVALATLTMEEV